MATHGRLKVAQAGAAALLVTAALGAAVGPVVGQTDEATRPLRIRVDSIEGLPNPGGDQDFVQPVLRSFIFSSLYRIDDRLQPMPDLVVEPCTPSDEGRVLTCTLVETTFHDGTPLSAADVAYTFELANATCGVQAWYLCLLPGVLEGVMAVDARTVRFQLGRPDATFVTDILSNVRIAARADIEASFARFDQVASTLDADEVARIHQALLDDPLEDCQAAIIEPLRILTDAGAQLWDRGEFADVATGGFDACRYAGHLEQQLVSLEAYLGASGIDRVSASLSLLDLQRDLNGTGPWRVVELRPGEGLTLEAFEGHHHGRPAIDRVEVVVEPDAAVAVELLSDGALDLSTELRIDMYDQVRDLPGLRLAEYPSSVYFYVAYNVRGGRLFAEKPLRQAVARCINKVRAVETATSDRGLAIESDILPGTWAYQPDLRTPARDVVGARTLIESAGWTAGSDGVYEREGQRLAADLYLRADHPARMRFAELLALQVRDCGMEITVRGIDQPTEMEPMMFDPPHLAPGSDEPFDMLMAAWGMPTDPNNRPLWHSQERTEIEGSQGFNVVGYANPRVDELLDEALATYDIRARARAYREIQDILADEQPYLFAWVETGIDVLSDDLTSTDGPLNLDSQRWWWRPEDLAFDLGASG